MSLSRRLRPAVLAALLAAASFFGALPLAPVSPVAAASLPECRYDDVLTTYTDYSDWQITLLDTIYRLKASYSPPGLVSTANAGLNAGGKVRKLVIGDLTAMATAARNADAGLRVVSAYRSYASQRNVYNREVDKYGEKAARLTVARPGHSEHQLGTTIDFGSAKSARDAWQYDDWAKTAAGSWMKSNAWKFGFVMSYPSGKRDVTCYRYEPWHYRYVGRDMAAKIHDSGQTLREYLWFNFHQ